MALPKVIPPKKHFLLDVLTIGTFLGVAGLWWRRKRAPAVAALVNGLFVLGYTALTDFDGDGRRPISFKTHGDLDAIQASVASAAPRMFRMRGREALFFRGQALNEAMVISMTDFEANERGQGIRRLWRRAA